MRCCSPTRNLRGLSCAMCSRFPTGKCWWPLARTQCSRRHRLTCTAWVSVPTTRTSTTITRWCAAGIRVCSTYEYLGYWCPTLSLHLAWIIIIAQVRCADKKTNGIVMICLAVYVILTYLLLFNLLIAIFNKAIEKIQGELLIAPFAYEINVLVAERDFGNQLWHEITSSLRHGPWRDCTLLYCTVSYKVFTYEHSYILVRLKI